jgi:hypothetical protein
MKKKRKTVEMSQEWRERHERTQRALLERLEYHARRREQQRAEQQAEGQS